MQEEITKNRKPLLEISTQELDAFIKRATERLEIKIKELANEKEKLEQKISKRTQEIEAKAKEADDSRRALMNILEDVEETRLEAVRERDKTISVINSFIDGLMIVDKNNNLELVNPAAEDYFDLKKEEIKGKNIQELKKNVSLEGALELFFKDGNVKEIDRGEFSPKKEVTMEVTTISLKDEEENFGHLIVFHDISREKMVERLKTEFVSVAAHQLRTPLSAIRWSISLLREENLSKEDSKELIEKCAQSNDRMISLVNDLLNVSRIEEGRYVYELELKDILEITKKSIQAAREEAKKKKVEFKFILPKEKVPQVKVDIEKISLAIQNLAENATHYTKEGGKVLFKIDYNKKRNEILFTIKDDGVGIPKTQQKRIFTKFFRAENVMRMETEGSGLGLFITKNIIESHGGKIWFKSEEGKGTTFYFTLPVSKEKFGKFLEEF